MRGVKLTVSFDSIKNTPMSDVSSRHGCMGSSNFRAVENGPLISVYDYRNQNRRTRSDKGFSLRAMEDISPNVTIARFEGNIISSSTVTENLQSIILCGGMSMVRPNAEEFNGIHVAWCANDARFEDPKKMKKNNSKISGYGHIRCGKRTAVTLVSTCKIWANEEIFCNYGRTYSVIKKARNLRKSSINTALDSLRVHDRREHKKRLRDKKGLIPLKRGRCKKWCKNTKKLES